MQTRATLAFARPPTEADRRVLTAYGTPDASAPLTWWLHSRADADRVVSLLSPSAGLPERRVRYVPGPEDDPRELATYLPTADERELEPADDPRALLAFDASRRATVGNSAVVRLLGLPTSWWHPVGGNSDRFVLTTGELPEPVIVPRALEASEGTRAWLVRSDGREFLTDRNRRFLADQGVVSTRECVLNGRVLHWVRPLIVRGDVYGSLVDAEVRGLLEPHYLGRSAPAEPLGGGEGAVPPGQTAGVGSCPDGQHDLPPEPSERP